MSAGPVEKDTCRDYVLPLLKSAGWGDDQIVEQYPITAGRVITAGKKHRRGSALRADYVLEFEPGLPVAVVEAKREYAIPGKGFSRRRTTPGCSTFPSPTRRTGRASSRTTGTPAARTIG
jgi:type I restriction enzyme, R subunit